LVAEAKEKEKANIFVLNSHNKLQIMLIKSKIFLGKHKTMAFWQKTWHFGKITAFTAFDENHGFRDFRDYLLSLRILVANL